MSELDILHGYGEELRKRLFLKTHPLAVKMLESEEDIPKDAQRPLRDFGYHLAQCQATGLSRRNGISVAMLKEDQWCPEPVIGYGFAEPPDFFLEGHTKYPGNVENLEAGREWAQVFPRFEYGKYIGIVSAPLINATFEPDVVIIYCNPAQMTQILQSARWKTGSYFEQKMSGSSACVYDVVPPIQSQEYQVSLPCGGDRTHGGAQDDELIFAMPRRKLEDFIAGLIYIDENYRSLPYKFEMKPEYELVESYNQLKKMLGMHS